jgi:hypothetical protein
MISDRSRFCSFFDICTEVKIEILCKWSVKISSVASYLFANTILLAASDKNFTAIRMFTAGDQICQIFGKSSAMYAHPFQQQLDLPKNTVLGQLFWLG